MKNKSSPFKEQIKSGLVRIVLRVNSVICEVKNDAPDFVDPMSDHPTIKITPEDDIPHLTYVFQKNHPLVLNSRKSKDGKLVWDLKQDGIWFDIPMDSVKDIWLTKFNFYIQSEKPRYITYYIMDVEHKVEWLQEDESGTIIALSEFKKKFSPPPVSARDTFTGADVIKCSDMIGRAARKIDMRTGNAMVKFNTEEGHLEALLMGMADKLGFKIEALDKETILNEDEKGNSVSHSISLK